MTSFLLQPTSSRVPSQQILEQAKAWGFWCRLGPDGEDQILSQNLRERWLLQRTSEGWLLSVSDVPQINFLPAEALTFLERRYHAVAANGGNRRQFVALN